MGSSRPLPGLGQDFKVAIAPNSKKWTFFQDDIFEDKQVTIAN